VQSQDMLVGVVAGLLGVVLIMAAFQGWSWYRQMKGIRWLESRLGHAWTVRLTFLLGLLLIAMGILIARGFSYWE
jgi:uncharacterized membrane protein